MKQKSSEDSLEVLSVETNAPAGRAGQGLLWLVVLLVAALAGAGGAWLWRAQQAMGTDIAQLAHRAETPAGVPAALPDPRAEEALHALQKADQEIAALNARVTQLSAAQTATVATLDLLGSADKRDWALAEAEYLMRLASQSLLMGREVRGAIALLDAADQILRAQGDPGLHEARASLARDRASLQAVADFDVEGLYLRLAALGTQLPALTIDERSLAAPRDPDAAAARHDAGAGWWARVQDVVDRYIVVRQRTQPVKPLLPLAEEQYLRVNQRLALEQAKLALLAAEPAIYRGALGEATALTRSYFSSEAPANRAFLAELQRLAAVDIAPALPDISASLRALRERHVSADAADEG